MDDATQQLFGPTSITEDVKLYPNCTIAGCSCNSRKGQWYRGCQCPCHYPRMDQRYGRNAWSGDLFELESNSQPDVFIQPDPPYAYSLGPEPQFSLVAELAKTYGVWRKVANLCTWLHHATDFPFFIIPAIKCGGYRVVEAREKFQQALKDTKVPDIIKLELTRLLAEMTEYRIRDAYGFDRVVFLPSKEQAIPVSVDPNVRVPLIGRAYKVNQIIYERGRCFLKLDELPGEWAADLFRGNLTHPALQTIYR